MQTPPSSFHIVGGGHPSSDTGSSTQAIEEELKRSLKNKYFEPQNYGGSAGLMKVAIKIQIIVIY
jgi:hypothetical protein